MVKRLTGPDTATVRFSGSTLYLTARVLSTNAVGSLGSTASAPSAPSRIPANVGGLLTAKRSAGATSDAVVRYQVRPCQPNERSTAT